MENKILSFIAGSVLLVPILGVGLVAGVSKVSQVHAQELAVNAPSTHFNHMASMMGGKGTDDMVHMMKEHHGRNWVKECNSMMDSMQS